MRSKITIADIKDFRQLCEDRINEIDPNRSAELALSGGTDSLTVLFSMLATGRKPRCITFYVEGVISGDLISSRGVCKHWGLELKEVVLPQDPNSIITDLRQIMPHCHKIKKTIIQCMHPWLYIYPAMRSDLILNGLGGDDLYCNQRKVAVELSKFGEDHILKYRHVYSDDLDFTSGNILRYGKSFNKTNIDFYNFKALEDWFLQFKASALNSPYEKYPSIAAFIDFYKQGPFRRHHSSYQINSKLRDVHDKLLWTSYNKTKAKAIIAVYNSLARELGIEKP